MAKKVTTTPESPRRSSPRRKRNKTNEEEDAEDAILGEGAAAIIRQTKDDRGDDDNNNNNTAASTAAAVTTTTATTTPIASKGTATAAAAAAAAVVTTTTMETSPKGDNGQNQMSVKKRGGKRKSKSPSSSSVMPSPSSVTDGGGGGGKKKKRGAVDGVVVAATVEEQHHHHPTITNQTKNETTSSTAAPEESAVVPSNVDPKHTPRDSRGRGRGSSRSRSLSRDESSSNAGDVGVEKEKDEDEVDEKITAIPPKKEGGAKKSKLSEDDVVVVSTPPSKKKHKKRDVVVVPLVATATTSTRGVDNSAVHTRNRSRSRSRSRDDPSSMMMEVDDEGPSTKDGREDVQKEVVTEEELEQESVPVDDKIDTTAEDKKDSQRIEKRKKSVKRKSTVADKDGSSSDWKNMNTDEMNDVDDTENKEGTKDNMDVDEEEHPLLPINKKKKKKKLPPLEPRTFKPTTDMLVHRLRHLNYMPSPVTAMASTTDGTDGYVAVSREDGTYELKMVATLEEYPRHFSPHVVTVSELDAPNEATVAQSLCWVPTGSTTPANNNNTGCCCLVAASPNGSLWIVDWKRSKICSPVSSGGGGIFDLAHCVPLSQVDESTGPSLLPLVAAACQDGSVRIWRVNCGAASTKIEDPPLVIMPSAGAPILSLAWKCIAVQEVIETESSVTTTSFQTILFAAVADGTIRKYALDLDQKRFGTDATIADGARSSTIDGQEANVQYNVRQQKAVLRMTVESKGRRTPTKVWTLAVLGGEVASSGGGRRPITLVAGNSIGQVQFWNANTGTLEQTILQTSLRADVLKVVASADGTKVFCSGVDSRVVCLERMVTDHPTEAHQQQAWKLTNAQRPHTHDVKALAIISASSPPLDASSSAAPRRLETLISGGMDMKLCSYEVNAFAKKRPQIWYPWPFRTPISTTEHFTATTSAMDVPRLLAMKRRDCIELHQLQTLELPLDVGDDNKPELNEGDEQICNSNMEEEMENSCEEVGDSGAEDTLPDDKTRNERKSGSRLLADESHNYTVQQHQSSLLVGKIQLGGAGTASCLQTSQLSPNGNFLAVSNASSLFVFYLNRTMPDRPYQSVEIEPIKLKLPEAACNVAASALQFWGNTLFVGDANHRQVHVVDLNCYANRSGDAMGFGVEESTMVTVALPELLQDVSTEMALPVQSIHVSQDGKFMATMCHVRENALHIFQRVDGDDGSVYKHYWTLPNLGDRPASMTMIENSQVAVATYQSRVYIFDIIEKKLSPFSERHGFPIDSSKWTEDLLCRRDFPIRLRINPRDSNQLIMTSYGTFCVLNLQHIMPRYCRVVPEKHVRRRRRRKPLPSGDQDANEVSTNHWLQPRVTKKVEDEYDDEDDDEGDEEGHSGDTSNKEENQKPMKRYIPMSKEELYARNCTICLHYNGMLYMDYLGPDQMVVVEQPWLPILATFPEALQRRIYGFN